MSKVLTEMMCGSVFKLSALLVNVTSQKKECFFFSYEFEREHGTIM